MTQPSEYAPRSSTSGGNRAPGDQNPLVALAQDDDPFSIDPKLLAQAMVALARSRSVSRLLRWQQEKAEQE